MKIGIAIFLGWIIGFVIANRAHKRIMSHHYTMSIRYRELQDMYDEAKEENEILKHRCRLYSHGAMCLYCPLECKNHRLVPYGGEEK